MGVLDKDSGQMDVYNAEIFNMQPLLSGRRVLCLTPVPGCGVLDLSVPSAISCLVPDDSALLSPGCSLFLISAFFPQLRGRRIRYIFPYKAPHDVKNREGSSITPEVLVKCWVEVKQRVFGVGGWKCWTQ